MLIQLFALAVVFYLGWRARAWWATHPIAAMRLRDRMPAFLHRFLP